MDEQVALVVFDSTNLALKTEKELASAGIATTVIPTPVEITSDCGIALLIPERWVGDARGIIALGGSTGLRLIHPWKRTPNRL